MHISSNRFRDKSDCKNFNSPEWICFTLRIVKSNHPKVFTLKLLVSLVFLGHHIVVFVIFHYVRDRALGPLFYKMYWAKPT